MTLSNTLRRTVSLTLLLGLVLCAPVRADGNFDAELADIQHAWAKANYSLTGRAQKGAFDALLVDARALAAAYPRRAEALIWQGIVASSYAGVKGPFGAMSLAKEAKQSLEQAAELNAEALQGSAYTSLGVLYYKVPGGLIGFGDKELARQYLEKALAMNPDGIDPNYFYGEFLFEQEEYEAARAALEHAKEAAPRADRPLADAGRKKEINALLKQVSDKLARNG